MEPWLQLASDGTSKKREPLILRREVTHSRSSFIFTLESGIGRKVKKKKAMPYHLTRHEI